MSEADEKVSDVLDLEFWFDRESRPYKIGRGRSGVQINARECPACGDTRYRTYLNAETGLGNCFVCGTSFNKVSFIHRCLGFDPDHKGPSASKEWRETFRHIREIAREQGWRPKRSTEVAVATEQAKFPNSFPLPTPDGRTLAYLKNRGFDAEIARYFHLRYCQSGTWRFTRDDGTPGWQRFDGRVIIPVYDLDGTFVTFQGRDITGTAGDKKYLFPSGLPGTGRYLLNGQNAAHAKRICLAEGFGDVAAAKLAFETDWTLRDVVPVGTFGKALSYGAMDGNDQLGRLLTLKRQGLVETTIMWDGEHMALLAALDAAALLRSHGFVARIALLPAGKDPNEVPPAVVCKAFIEAQTYTPALAVRWKLNSPYKR